MCSLVSLDQGWEGSTKISSGLASYNKLQLIPWDLLPNLPCRHSHTSRDFQGKCGHQRAAQAAASAYCNLRAGSSLWPVKGYYQRLHQALHSLQDHNVSSWNVRIPLGLYIGSNQRYGKCFDCGHSAFADASFLTHKG